MTSIDLVVDRLVAALPQDVPAPYPGVAGLLAARVAADGAGPLLTFYDDASGERTELSATTLDNWVSKTANMLADGLGVAEGDAVAVGLPLHWQTAVVLLATWSVGAVAVTVPHGEGTVELPDETGDRSADGDLLAEADPVAAFVTPELVNAVPPSAEVVALSLRPLAGRLERAVPGVLDYAAEVPAYGDHFRPAGLGGEQTGLVRLGIAAARRWDLTAADRVLVTEPYDTPAGLVGGLLAPLAGGASTVACRHLDPDALARRLGTERVTAVCGDLPLDVPLPPAVRTLTLGRLPGADLSADPEEDLP